MTTAQPSPPAATPTPQDALEWALILMQSRHTTLPKRLIEPGPDNAQRQAILSAAAHAPDHDRLRPWRFVDIPVSARERLAQAFEQALCERDTSANEAERLQAREKAFRAPWLLLCVVRVSDEQLPDVPAQERLLSAGAAIQNLLLASTALGYGSAVTSGKALQSQALRALFHLSAQEEAVCFINIGTVSEGRPGKPRPQITDYYSRLD